jgi:putative membrane protein
MAVDSEEHPGDRADEPQGDRQAPLPLVRTGLAGILMGLANLVPGISGGTMIVVMGLYDEFITAVADATRLRFSKRNLLFLTIVCGTALIAVASLAGTLSRAVTLHRSAMFSLFIGMTLGGVPLLVKMLGRLTKAASIGIVFGLALMVVIAVTNEPPPDRQAVEDAVAAGEFVVEPNYPRDLLAGVLGMSAMVLPGVSGAYMLLILGRYEAILAAISMAKSFLLSGGGDGDAAVCLNVVIPVGIGAIVSLVALSNVLKWMLHRYQSFTVGALLGILLGSVVGIWPFDASTQLGDYVIGVALAIAGFAATAVLSRLGA